MAQTERFANLPEYAFPRLRALLSGFEPGGPVTSMTIGEPRHPFPAMVGQILTQHLDEWGKYPPNAGTPDLLGAISDWIAQRHGITVPPAQITALNGSREGLFNAALALCPREKGGQQPIILIPNPFYQVYATAAAACDAQPVFVPATAASGHLPDVAALDTKTLDRTALAYLCSPANPQGSIASRDYLERLIELADRHDFLILADECYSEIWRDAPPPGALAVAHAMGLPDRVVMFNSLSKRSNLPGLRSGFAAGGPEQIRRIRQLRDYGGAPLPLPVQRVSAAIWRDEDHVTENRALYLRKYAISDRILGNIPGYLAPQGGFFLWLPVPPTIGTGEDAARLLWTRTGIQVLPGEYLAREADGANPGRGFIRVALVAGDAEIEAALSRLKTCLYQEG